MYRKHNLENCSRFIGNRFPFLSLFYDLYFPPKIRQLLNSTTFLEIHHEKGKWRVLVREEGMSSRPSLLISLTP